ncbi:GNAT family N-acetyltransferase [Haloarchaeobius amylolyticus]|uniref:GNAT family N-acetyltransferase n=1 Tax=Haloarchaeobius amylolyticus TaxID=1198296 RepID=UPI002271C609|nr:GNAT family N-acetyltransferase [Haloarchaeobius amylolyticus]
MPPTLELRRYQPADQDRVRELHEAAMREVGAYVADAPDTDLETIPETYLAEGTFLVGEVDGRIVAMGALRPATGYITEFVDDLPETTAVLKRMRVDPAHQRQGYGSRLLAALEDRARELGFTELVLDTTPTQVAAKRLYESHGYEQVQREQVRLAGEELVLLCYRKSLE